MTNPRGVKHGWKTNKQTSPRGCSQENPSKSITKCLQNHALGETEELSPTRMKAIEILLRKSMPDMASVTISGDQDQPLQHIVTWAK